MQTVRWLVFFRHFETFRSDCTKSTLEKRSARLQYPTFQSQGWPIASGMTENANKLVVAARLKGAGMHWAREQVNPMIALRNIVCSNR